MQIANPESEAEMNRLVELYKEVYPAFVGIADESSEGKWYNFGSGAEISFPLKFHSGEPNNYEGPENCLEVRKVHGVVAFNDVPCDSTQAFVCEKVEKVDFSEAVIASLDTTTQRMTGAPASTAITKINYNNSARDSAEVQYDSAGDEYDSAEDQYVKTNPEEVHE